MKFVFFGTPKLATVVLDALAHAGYVPTLIVTNPDAPVGRKHILTPPPTKVWAEAHHVPVFQPRSLNNHKEMTPVTDTNWDLFIVVAYGKLMPQWLINIPKHKTVNVHPSLLPQLRGASPIRSAILEDIRETGVTVMQMDEKLDHGPIIAQKKISPDIADWPLRGRYLDHRLAIHGGQLLTGIIPTWLAGEIMPAEQDNTKATFSAKITKDMGELSLDPYHLPYDTAAYQMLLKIRAFDGWPETFFIHNGKRIKIRDAELDANGTLRITRIVPEGKTEMDFNTFFREPH